MSIGLKGNNDGSGAIQVGGSDAISISTGLIVTMNGGVVYPLTSGTAVTASGTSIDFTGIPATAKRITVMFSGVSTNGASLIQVQIGHIGGIENTSYLSSGSIGSSITQSNLTSGFNVDNIAGAASVRSLVGTLVNVSGNAWAWACVGGTGAQTILGGGSKTLSDTLDRIRITTVNGTDVFDAGTINILWE